ncbi:MAG: aldose epimerase, partial [Actinomycetota bacterium]|nr:aldose epimerase [Actinomycetota bacterium]
MPPTVEPVLPSGEQVELVRGDQRVVVTEVGAALRRYSMGDRAILDGFASGEMPRGGRGQVLAPWPNRLAGGRYRFGDEEHQVPLDEPGRGNANHGLVRWVN